MHIKYRITNIKISFKWHEKIIIKTDKPYLEYYQKNMHIVKYEGYSASLMSNDTFCNITGIKSSYHILKALKIISDMSNIVNNKIFYNVNCISATFSCLAGMRNTILTKGIHHGFSVEAKIKFIGLCIRHELMCKASITYFQSGKCIIMGVKTFEDIKSFITNFCLFLNKISDTPSVNIHLISNY